MRILALLLFFTFANASSVYKEYLEQVRSGNVNKDNVLEYIVRAEKGLTPLVENNMTKFQNNSDNFGKFDPKTTADKYINQWKKHSKNMDLKKTLKAISEDPTIILGNKELIKSLKENRKLGMVLREMYYIFNKTHKPPKSVGKAVKSFGKLNDAIASKNIALIKKYATETLKGMNKFKFKQLSDSFKYVTKPEMYKYFNTVSHDIEKILGKSRIDIEEYHKLRKLHKKYLSIYMNLNQEELHPKAKQLDKLISKIGQLNDIYVDAQLRYGTDLESHKIIFDDRFKVGISKTLSSISTDINKIKFKKCHGLNRVLQQITTNP